MRKSYFLSIFLFFTIHSIVSAQSNSYIGVGTSFDFNKSIASTNSSSSGLQPTDFSFENYSIHAFWNLNSDKVFQFRINTRLSGNSAQFTSEELEPFGDLMINSVLYSWVSFNVGLTGLYGFSLNENNKLLPAVGAFWSYNSNNGYSFSRNDGTEFTAQDFDKLPTNLNRPHVSYFGMNVGLLYQTNIKKRLIEFYGMFYFSSEDSFELTYEYENMNDMTYVGRQQSIALGINVPILLKRNRYKSEE